MLDALIDEMASRPPVVVSETDRPEAAVAVILAPDPDQLLLIVRAERAGDPWSGHVALPGGRRDPADVDLLTTAIRETCEETGLVLRREWYRAQLDDLVPRTPRLPRLTVRPFVFVLPSVGPAGISAEVTASAWVPLADFFADGVARNRSIDIGGTLREVGGYELVQGFLWGMTERILTPVIDAWRRTESRGG